MDQAVLIVDEELDIIDKSKHRTSRFRVHILLVLGDNPGTGKRAQCGLDRLDGHSRGSGEFDRRDFVPVVAGLSRHAIV